jgi:glycosyltransferase involved in cell wall biosynthesis
MRGFWADERVDGKLWNLKHPVFKTIYHYFKRKEIDFLRNADYTISLTHTAKEELLSWVSIPDTTPVKVIPCCVDLELFNKATIQTEKLNHFRDELGIAPKDKVLLYLGSIGTWYMLEEMMEFFSVLKQQEPDAKFLFVTKDEHERIINCAEKYQVRQDILLRPGARAEIPYLIRLSNYSVFFILPAYSKKASSPTKQGEIMAMGIPVICNAHVGDTDKIIADYKSGIVVEGFNSTAYTDAIKKLDAGFSEEQIIKCAADYFSLENGVVGYAEVYASVLDS